MLRKHSSMAGQGRDEMLKDFIRVLIYPPVESIQNLTTYRYTKESQAFLHIANVLSIHVSLDKQYYKSALKRF